MRKVIPEPLAINGGVPVRPSPLPYGRHSIDEDDIAAVVRVLRSGWLTTGPRVAEFETAVAEYVGARYAVAFSSGTAALHAAAFAADLGPGDEAITTPLTFAATASCIAFQGAKPVFADVSPESLNIDPQDVARRITSRTKAILPVDFAGCPVELDAIMDLADRHGLTVIEDACHALSAQYKGRNLGTISHMSVFSFHPVKHITSGEGGMVLTNDETLAERMKTFRHHGMVYPDREHPWNYEIREIGYNYRVTDMQCALGLSQLHKLEGFLQRREALARRYQDHLADSPFVSLPVAPDYVRHAWHLFVALLNIETLSADRDTVMGALRGENIGVQLHYPLVHLHPYYRRTWGYSEGTCPVAESLFHRLITLPLFPAMSDDDQEDVLRALDKVLTTFSSSPM